MKSHGTAPALKFRQNTESIVELLATGHGAGGDQEGIGLWKIGGNFWMDFMGSPGPNMAESYGNITHYIYI